MSKASSVEKSGLPHELFKLSCELRGLSELFAHQDFHDPAGDIDECMEGIGYILRDMGERLRRLYVDADKEAGKSRSKLSRA